MADNHCWVLTSEYNEYDQHGEYFVDVWDHKPSKEEVYQALVDHNMHSNLTRARYAIMYGESTMELAQHLLDGGARRNDEEQWFHLRQEPFRKPW